VAWRLSQELPTSTMAQWCSIHKTSAYKAAATNKSQRQVLLALQLTSSLKSSPRCYLRVLSASVNMVCYPSLDSATGSRSHNTERPIQLGAAPVNIDTQGPGPVCGRGHAFAASPGAAQCLADGKLAQQEPVQTKQEKAFERLKNFRSELDEYRTSFKRIKSANEDVVRIVRLLRHDHY
jgi:hypothetical protein